MLNIRKKLQFILRGMLTSVSTLLTFVALNTFSTLEDRGGVRSLPKSLG